MFCPHCGNEIAADETFCRSCGARTGFVPAFPVGERAKTAWEDREQVGFLSGLFMTLKDILFTPALFFRKMPVAGGITDPLIYALITGMAGIAFFCIWDILLHDLLGNLLMPEGNSHIRAFGAAAPAVAAPFLLIVSLFVASGALHLLLLMVRGARSGFEATFRVVSYSMSPLVFLIIPFCGTPITLFWALVLVLVGLKEAHRTTGGRAAFAVLFPFFFCCGLIALGVALFLGAIASTFGELMQL